MAVKTLRLADLLKMTRPRDGRPLVVHHFATWCGPCADEMPVIDRLAAELSDRADFVVISWDLFMLEPEEGVQAVESLVREAGLKHDILVYQGEPPALIDAYGVSGGTVPYTQVYSPKGGVIWSWDGVLDEGAQQALRQVVTG